jgi:hypothetical protein
LIKIWHGDTHIKDLEWETDDENKLYEEVAESVPKEVRVTIENVERGNEKTR